MRLKEDRKVPRYILTYQTGNDSSKLPVGTFHFG